MIAERSIDSTRLLCNDYEREDTSATRILMLTVDVKLTSGTSLDTMRVASPSRMAVLPTPGGPMSWRIVVRRLARLMLPICLGYSLTTGFDFVRRDKTLR